MEISDLQRVLLLLLQTHAFPNALSSTGGELACASTVKRVLSPESAAADDGEVTGKAKAKAAECSLCWPSTAQSEEHSHRW